MRNAVAVVLAVVLGLGSAGCGGSDSTGATGPTIAAASGPSTAQPSPMPTPTHRIVYDRSVDEFFSFVTPSGNLHCAIYPSDRNVQKGSLRCDVLNASWQLGPKPADCDFDWAKVLTLERKAAAGACVSDAVDVQGADTVRYGTGVRWRNITCQSDRTGLTCTNTDNGVGFTVSRSDYTLT